MTTESTGSGAGDELPSVDEVIDSARDLSGVERPILPPDPALAAAGAVNAASPTAASNASGTAFAGTGHGAAPSVVGQPSGHGSPSGQGAASGHATLASAGHAGSHDDAHDAHDPRDTNLGPPDLAAWSAGIVGVVIALIVAVCFALAAGVIGS